MIHIKGKCKNILKSAAYKRIVDGNINGCQTIVLVERTQMFENKSYCFEESLNGNIVIKQCINGDYVEITSDKQELDVWIFETTQEYIEKAKENKEDIPDFVKSYARNIVSEISDNLQSLKHIIRDEL